MFPKFYNMACCLHIVGSFVVLLRDSVPSNANDDSYLNRGVDLSAGHAYDLLMHEDELNYHSITVWNTKDPIKFLQFKESRNR